MWNDESGGRSALKSDKNGLDLEDLARILTAFRGQPSATSSMRLVNGSSDGLVPSYVWDDETGMVYILD